MIFNGEAEKKNIEKANSILVDYRVLLFLVFDFFCYKLGYSTF